MLLYVFVQPRKPKMFFCSVECFAFGHCAQVQAEGSRKIKSSFKIYRQPGYSEFIIKYHTNNPNTFLNICKLQKTLINLADAIKLAIKLGFNKILLRTFVNKNIYVSSSKIWFSLKMFESVITSRWHTWTNVDG